MRAALLAAVFLALWPPAATAALQRTLVLDVEQNGPVQADVDGDGSAETLRTVAHPVDGFLRRPVLEATCTGGGSPTWRLGPYQERTAVELLRVRESSAAPLLAVFGSSGATGRLQTTWVHRLRPGADGCPELRTVFRFPHRDTRTPRPPRGTAPGSFSTTPRAFRGRVWLRTFEGLYRSSDPGCCPSFTRTIDWKPRGGSYVRAKTRLRRLPEP